MELVYLWVEDYKNIKKQGFNFSSKFTYDYDGKELTIKENDDYIENFFGEKINVMAIVVENGSGKSSVLEILTQISYEDNIKNIGSFLYLLKEEKSYKCFSYNLKIQCAFTTCSNKPIYKNTLENIRNYNKIKIVLTQHINVSYLNISHFDRDKIIKNDERADLDKLIYLGVFHKKNHMQLRKESTQPLFDEFNPSNFHFTQIQRIINLLKMPKYKNLILDYLNIESIYYLVVSYDEEVAFAKLDAIEKDNSLDINPNEITKLKDILKNKFFEIDSERYNNLFQSLNHIFKGQGEIPFKLNLYSKSETPIHFSGGENTILFYIEKIALLLFDLIDKKKSTILLFDEVELYLHPNWQKKIISIIIEIFKIESLNNPIQLIITSHSPFILSDLPRENIIFLKNGKNDKGINHKQTFGANIHTLLSDSFFMEDGLMGEFAKNKIDEAIRLLNKDKLDEKDLKYCEQIISIIGEPIVKNQLEKMLHYKKVDYLAKDTREEIEFLKHRIDLLSKRL
jgi:predicted ATP-binding protein involved in virulence